MSLKIQLNKNGKHFTSLDDDFHKPSAHNPIYQKDLHFLGCQFCDDKKGRRKNFKTLWTLYMHIRLNHRNEIDNFKKTVWNLADYVMKGVIA